MTKKDACESVAKLIIADLGDVDILINNAGITQPIRIMDVKPENYDAVMDVSLRGMLYLSQAFIPHFISRGGGSIACTSSVSAQTGRGFFGGPHYSAAKAGMLGLAKDLARELGPKNIRVNAVAPGMVATDIRGDKMSQELFDRIVSGNPYGADRHTYRNRQRISVPGLRLIFVCHRCHHRREWRDVYPGLNRRCLQNQSEK